MVRQTFFAAAAFAAVLVLSSCSETPATTEAKVAEVKKDVKPEAVAGQSAFYQMYKPARQWATDLMPLTLAGSDIGKSAQQSLERSPRWPLRASRVSIHKVTPSALRGRLTSPWGN